MAARCRQATAAIMQSNGYGLPAPAEHAYGTVEIGAGIEGAEAESQQETAQVGLAGVAAGPGEHLHHHRFGDRDRAVGRDDLERRRSMALPVARSYFDPG